MKKLDGKNIAILVERDYQDLEVWYPKLRFYEEGANVIVIGTGEKKYIGKYGYPIDVDMNIDKANADNFDAVIIPGGWAPDYLRRYESVIKFVKNMYKKGKIIGAICHGPSVLVSCGILKGKTVTCFFAIKDDVIAAGAKFVDKEVVIDGNIITSRNPYDLPSFCKSIIDKLQEPFKKS
jgi:protease I